MMLAAWHVTPYWRPQRNPQRETGLTAWLLACLLSLSGYPPYVNAGSMLTNCYAVPELPAPENKPSRALYVFIDQTMELTTAMKDAVVELVSPWGKRGENVKLSRFSANIQGQYSELVFDEIGNIPPSEEYLFHLRYQDKQKLLACLEEHKDDFKNKLVNTLTNTLKLTDTKLPKTNLIHSLNDFATQLVADPAVTDKTVLIISDGLENSDLFSFHKRDVIRDIDSREMLNKVRRSKLIPNWHQAKLYFMGLGYIADEKFYVRPRILDPLKTFWFTYFAEGNAVMHENSIGTPMLLTKSLQ